MKTPTQVYEPYAGMYHYKYLPGFAKFLLDHHLEEFCRDQLAFSRQLNLPILQRLAHMSDEEIITFTKTTASSFFNLLSENQGKEQISVSINNWYHGQLQIIDKFEIDAEDITGINYARAKAFKKRIPSYKKDLEEILELNSEIDTFFFGFISSGLNTYINILKSKIEENSYLSTQIINTSPGVTFLFDLEEKKEIFVSGNVEKVMGFTPDELLKMGSNILFLLTHSDDLSVLTNHLANLVDEKKESNPIEYRFKHKDGNYKWLRTYHTIFKRDDHGRPTQILGSTFEVTQEKEIALTLEKREQQLLEAQTIAQIGSFEWDIVNDSSVSTPQLRAIFELEKRQPYEEFLKHVHPADKEKIEREIAKSFVTGYYDCEYRYIARSGEKIIWSRGAVLFEDTKPVLMRGTVQDITQRKKVEVELIKKTIELQRRNEDLQHFASVASHDLKEPLRKIGIFTDKILSSEGAKLSDASRTELKKVRESTKRMQHMVEDILNFSSLTSEEQRTRTDLNNIIDEVLEVLEQTIKENNVIITKDHLPQAIIIPSQFKQLFQNLISNAVKFARKDRPAVINISHSYLDESAVLDIKPPYRFLQLKVTDNGIGFEPEYSEKIFQLFGRLHSKSAYEGSGLGLAICKKIAENHGGTISAVSAPGEGATFIVQIPAN